MGTNDRHPSLPIDPGKLEQILRVQEPLLTGHPVAQDLLDRVCQRTAILIGAEAARLVLLRGDGSLEVKAAYGRGDFALATPEVLREALSGSRPAVHRSTRDRRVLLSIPLPAGEPSLPQRTGEPLTVLQLSSAPERPFSVEQIALARYAASLVAVAMRQAGVCERLEHADQTKSEVLIAMSHDLRSPLNVVLGYTRLLLEDAYGPCADEQREILTTIEQHALELLSLLSGVLDLMRLEMKADDPRREEFSLAEVVRELCTGSLAHRVSNGVRLDWRVDPEIPSLRGDRVRVRQILQNLLDNAVRFTERGSVHVAATPYTGGVRLTVSDTGPGIGAGDLPHLFEVFRPGREGTPSGGGTGCGLYLVKRFSESLGGRVTVDSTPGVGTRFTVDLPLGPSAPAAKGK